MEQAEDDAGEREQHQEDEVREHQPDRDRSGDDGDEDGQQHRRPDHHPAVGVQHPDQAGGDGDRPFEHGQRGRAPRAMPDRADAEKFEPVGPGSGAMSSTTSTLGRRCGRAAMPRPAHGRLRP